VKEENQRSKRAFKQFTFDKINKIKIFKIFSIIFRKRHFLDCKSRFECLHGKNFRCCGRIHPARFATWRTAKPVNCTARILVGQSEFHRAFKRNVSGVITGWPPRKRK